ncbi:hypothetical protein I4U23_013553 [Adineta vaga]|nr:hypothetical protein I4U23_013553 [Adineta vaga]
MSTKSKKVTYKDPAEDNADYLVPLQYDLRHPLPGQIITSSTATKSGGYLNSIYFLITILLYAGVPISQFVIGLIYVGQCTVRQFISPYMILSGISGISFVIVSVIVNRQLTKQSSLSYAGSRPNPMVLKILISLTVILFLLVVAWFFAGQFIVFEVKLRVEFFDPVLPEYCHGHLYKAAYILIFVDYLLFLVAIILYAVDRMSPPEDIKKKKTKRPVRIPRK